MLAFITEGHYQDVNSLRSELGLHSIGDVGRLLFEMVEHLKSLLPPHEKFAYSQQSFALKHTSLERCRLSLDDMTLLSMYVDFGHQDDPSIFLTFDKDGNDLWVCHYHYRRLDPNRRQYHIKHSIKGVGKHVYSAGTIEIELRSPKDIAAVYSIDRVKAGLVAELNVTLAWRLSPREFGQLADCATYLGLTTLCMTERTGSGENSPNLTSQQSALKEENTAYVKSLLRPTVDVGLERISFDWESSLDMCALYQDMRVSKCKVLHLEVKTGDQEVSSVVVNSDLGVCHLKSDAELFITELGGTYLVERAENIELLSKRGSYELVTEAIPMAIQGSSVLRSLTLDCKARSHDFKRVVNSIENIVKPFDNGRFARLPLRDLIIIDRTDNDATARFDLMRPIPEGHSFPQPVALDITSRFSPVIPTTAGSGGLMTPNQTVSSLLKAYGSVVRVLHLIGPNPSCPNLMADLLESATEPKNLVSLTLRLDHLSENHVEDLVLILSSSKDIFKQLVLVGCPKDSENDKAATNLLEALEALDETVNGVQVLDTPLLPLWEEYLCDDDDDDWNIEFSGIARDPNDIKDTNANNACLEVSRLDSTPQELAESRSSMTQHLFILPQGWTPGTLLINNTQTPFKLFRISRQTIEHIQRELGLPDVDAVMTLLEQIIKYLEYVLLPRKKDAANTQPSSMSGNPILARSRLSLSDMVLLSMYVDFSHPDIPSDYLNFDKDGNDLWVCHHHYRCLDPGFQPNHVKRIINRFGRYDAATGRIDVHPRTSKDLAALCMIDPVKAARVTELNVALDWRISPMQLKQLVKWATSLNLTTLSVTGTKGKGGPSSVVPRSDASVVEEMNEVRAILRHTTKHLKRVTFTCKSDLDASTLLQDMSPLRDSHLYFKIKTGRQEEFEVILDAIRSVLRELHNPSIVRQPLHLITLKDSHSQMTVRFNITPLAHENQTVVDVTAGTIRPVHHSAMRKLGTFIRVLNVLDGAMESSELLREFARAKPSQLTSLMLTLDKFSYSSGNDLSTITTSSKNTFKQLVLIGHPRCSKTLSLLLDTIKSLHRCDVLVTWTEPDGMTTWIERIRGVIQKSSRLIVVESAEEIRLMVPDLSSSGFALLTSAFERNQRFVVNRGRIDSFTFGPGPGPGYYDYIADDVVEYSADDVVEYGPDGHPML
ncbi:hypothetical protein BGZ95_002023 [Linnemannia exigua]|uniref:Uncharacterized protein n=1 Tax=Linnemannia exigua TaxID=604196 RepID=A0AAD4H2B9_9FUNG|nr:hypothetical protein BGZ95_002023 [Linnemannia exigua]